MTEATAEGKVDGRPILEALAQCLSFRSGRLTQLATEGLMEWGAKIEPDLLELMDAPGIRPQHRANLEHALGRIKSGEQPSYEEDPITEALILAMRDQSASLREKASDALAIFPPFVVPRLVAEAIRFPKKPETCCPLLAVISRIGRTPCPMSYMELFSLASSAGPVVAFLARKLVFGGLKVEVPEGKGTQDSEASLEQPTDALKGEDPEIDTGQEAADVEPFPDERVAAEV